MSVTLPQGDKFGVCVHYLMSLVFVDCAQPFHFFFQFFVPGYQQADVAFYVVQRLHGKPNVCRRLECVAHTESEYGLELHALGFVAFFVGNHDAVVVLKVGGQGNIETFEELVGN